MKKILLIATGGTIASGRTEEGLSPKITAGELLQYVEEHRAFCEVEEHRAFCEVDVVQPFGLDSTNVYAAHWMKLAALIESHYTDYD